MTRHLRNAGVGLLGIMALGLMPGASLAADAEIRLALTPVDQAGSFFDLTMRPGSSRRLLVDVANVSDSALEIRTYAADVYTIVNGGFGAGLRDAARTGSTTWLGYPTEVMALPAAISIRRAFTVSVPLDAAPGEYITSLVLENDRPLAGSGAVAVNQIVRQAIAVVITVPGRGSAALEIGGAVHKLVAGTSTVAIAVDNLGNLRLRPIATFELYDASGTEISRAKVSMGTFYAHTATFVEVPLAALLRPGRYTVRLVLEDLAEAVRMEAVAIPFTVEASASGAAVASAPPGLTGILQDIRSGDVLIPIWAMLLAVAGLIGGAVAVLVHRRHRHAARV